MFETSRGDRSPLPDSRVLKTPVNGWTVYSDLLGGFARSGKIKEGF